VLTKITPGVGLLWFAFRREWRSLAIALGATGVIAGGSFAFAPHLWFEWVDVLTAAARAPDWQFIVPIPVWFRLPAAVAIVFWGARTDRRWTVPLASCVALPVLWFNGFAMLVAMLPLLDRTAADTPAGRWLQRQESRSAPATA
jgi:hypothetical protein